MTPASTHCCQLCPLPPTWVPMHARRVHARLALVRLDRCACTVGHPGLGPSRSLWVVAALLVAAAPAACVSRLAKELAVEEAFERPAKKVKAAEAAMDRARSAVTAAAGEAAGDTHM